MKELGGDHEDTLSMEKLGGYKTEVQEIIEEMQRLALRHKVNEEKNVEVYEKLREDVGIKTYLRGPMNYAKILKIRLRVRDLDLPNRRKRYTSSQEEEEGMNAQLCPCGTTVESRSHIVG